MIFIDKQNIELLVDLKDTEDLKTVNDSFYSRNDFLTGFFTILYRGNLLTSLILAWTSSRISNVNPAFSPQRDWRCLVFRTYDFLFFF